VEEIKRIAKEVGLVLIGAILAGNIVAFVYLNTRINKLDAGLKNVVAFLNTRGK